MAVIYLRSTGGNDADSGLTWALAKATLASAVTAAGAGGTIYVSDNHSESGAALSYAGTLNATNPPLKILCVDDTGDPEPPTALSTGAVVSGTTVALSGALYVYGVKFSASNSGSAIQLGGSNTTCLVLERCHLESSHATGGNINIGVGSTQNPNRIHLYLTDITVVGSSATVVVYTRTKWHGGVVTASGTPSLFRTGAALTAPANAHFSGLDLSSLGSGSAIVSVVGVMCGDIVFENCKLNASVSLVTGSWPNTFGGGIYKFIRCDSGDTNYKYHLNCKQGTIDHETTIVRTGGASDGTTPISRKMVSTSFGAYVPSHLVSDWGVVWNETTGSSITVTVETVTDNVTLKDNEAWLEVQYLGTSAVPLGSFITDGSGVLGAGTDQASSSVTWTTTGLTTPIKQKLSVSFTPQEKGPIYFRIHLMKASTTMYFCPKADVT